MCFGDGKATEWHDVGGNAEKLERIEKLKSVLLSLNRTDR
jgi:hypothetical protein